MGDYVWEEDSRVRDHKVMWQIEGDSYAVVRHRQGSGPRIVMVTPSREEAEAEARRRNGETEK